ncbi:hypothetical protein F543_21250 [Bibersteinia trehalosi USDA-ARS-USMARC-189]|uniref:Uncharacterized protein n=1 Tax=Bibersteinia trehalosi USDA-ARS-USMARC-189 TaxID=1263831 RepID=A0ABM5PFL9_BIBTR|nr:hypothetical protein F543_21250 [Bibersteinia trehalosi USDA-ARS-USMARC-189]
MVWEWYIFTVDYSTDKLLFCFKTALPFAPYIHALKDVVLRHG